MRNNENNIEFIYIYVNRFIAIFIGGRREAVIGCTGCTVSSKSCKSRSSANTWDSRQHSSRQEVKPDWRLEKPTFPLPGEERHHETCGHCWKFFNFNTAAHRVWLCVIGRCSQSFTHHQARSSHTTSVTAETWRCRRLHTCGLKCATKCRCLLPRGAWHPACSNPADGPPPLHWLCSAQTLSLWPSRLFDRHIHTLLTLLTHCSHCSHWHLPPTFESGVSQHLVSVSTEDPGTTAFTLVASLSLLSQTHGLHICQPFATCGNALQFQLSLTQACFSVTLSCKHSIVFVYLFFSFGEIPCFLQQSKQSHWNKRLEEIKLR